MPQRFDEQYLLNVLNSAVSSVLILRAIRAEGGQVIDFEPLFINQQAENLLKRRAEEIIGGRLSEYIDPRLPEEMISLCADVLETGQPATHEYSIPQDDQQALWLRYAIAQVAGYEDCVISITEITQRKIAEHMLEQKLEEIESFFTVALDLLCIADLQGHFVRVNPEWANLLGLSREELEGRLFLDFVHPEDIPATLEAIDTLRQHNVVINFVNRYRQKDGTYRWIEWRSYPQSNYIYAAARDITGRRKIEQDALGLLADMKALQEIHLVLSQVETLEALYIKMIEFCRDRLQIDRVALFLTNNEQTHLHGTYGVDPEGNIRTEHYYQDIITPNHWIHRIINAPGRAMLWENTPLIDNETYVGFGWNAGAALWNGERAIGYLVADNFLSNRPPRTYEVELLSVLGSTFGHLIERKRYENQRRHAEARYRALFEQSNDGVFILDLEGEHVMANRRSAQMLGYTMAEMARLSRRDLVKPDELAHSEQVVARLLAGENILPYERTFIRKDGSPITAEMSVEVVYDPDGIPLHIQSIMRDISQRKASEHHLRVLERAMDHSSAGVAILDASDFNKLTIVYVNEAMCRLTGYSAEEVIGKGFRHLQVADRTHPGFDKLRQAVLHHHSASSVIPSARKDGTPYWNEVWIAPVFDNQNRATHFVTTQLDVTERVRGELHLQGVLDSSFNGIMSFRPVRNIHGYIIDFEWTMVNRMAEQIIGRSAADLVGKRFNVEMPGHHKSGLFEKYVEVIETGKPLDHEHYDEHEGVKTWFHTVAIKLEDGIVVTFANITERKEAHQRAFDAALEKERLNLLTDFIQNAAHEFRTPLTVINSSAFLLQRADDPERRQLKVQQIEDQVTRMTRLVDNLLKMAQLERNLMQRKEYINLNEIFDILQTQLKPIKGRARIEFSGTSFIPPIMGSGEHLLEALHQVIDNALRFTPEEGIVKIDVTANPAWVHITVRDTGAGISPDTMPHIFQTFWREDSAHSTPGLGLGLSIAKRIIELHNGIISAESEVGHGSAFHIRLPIAPST